VEVNNFDSFNIYCGPAVLSIFTGARADDCADEISKINGQFKIKGVTSSDLIKTGESMGLRFVENAAFTGRSIFWAGSVLIKLPPGMYLVTIPKHYIALEVRDGNLYICDNHTKTEIELQNSSRLSQKIERLWRVEIVKPYSKPTIVQTEFAVDKIGMSIHIRMIHTLSDEGIKIIPIGSFSVTQHYKEELREIAFKLMELADERS